MADEYDDEDFEDYEDEFDEEEEEEENSLLPPPPQPAPPPMDASQIETDSSPTSNRPPERRVLQPKRAPVKVVGTVDVAPVKKHFIAPTTNAERSLQKLRAVRRAALLEAVQLEPVSFTLYESAPQTPYELLRREMKLRSKRVQTHDDDMEAATQTEDVDNDEQACQAPDDLSTQNKRALTDVSESARTAAALSANTARLNRFLTSASAVIEALCAENALLSAGGTGGFGPKSELPIATRSAVFALPKPFDARPPVDVAFTADGGSTLVAYGLHDGELPKGKKREDVAMRRACSGGGLLAVWIVHQPTSPWQLLRALGLPTRCAITSTPCRVAFAGSADGSIQMWDLREAGSRHESVMVGGERMALRSPTFCSDGGSLSHGHEAPVVALEVTEPIPGAETTDLVLSSMDASGKLIVWQLLEGDLSLLSLENGEAAADGFAYGQVVGGKLRLVQTSVIQTCIPPRGFKQKRGGIALDDMLLARTLCFAPLPSDPSKFLVGMDDGQLRQVSRYANGAPQPSEFTPPSTSTSAAITCLAFSPTQHDIFLAGRADASVSLYDISEPRPLLVLEPPSFAPAAQLAWSPTRPCVFFLLDGDATLHVFDLMHDARAPTHKAPLYSHASAGFGTAGSEVRVRIALGASNRARRGEVACYVGIAGGGGDVTLHLLQDDVAKPEPNEAFRLHQLLESL